MSKYLWLCVEADEYELPLAVADTASKHDGLMGAYDTIGWKMLSDAKIA